MANSATRSEPAQRPGSEGKAKSRIRSQTPADYFGDLAVYRKERSGTSRLPSASLLQVIRARDELLAPIPKDVSKKQTDDRSQAPQESDEPAPDESDGERDRGESTAAYPWVSLVLGSGALRGPDMTEASRVSIHHLVADGLEGLGRSTRGTDDLTEFALPELAEEFLADLTVAKLGLDGPVTELPTTVLTENLESRVLAVRAAVIAAMATRLYAEALTRTRVLKSIDREILHIDRFDPQVQPLLRDVQLPLVKFIRRALPTAESVSSRSVKAFLLLAQQVRADIADGDEVDIDRSRVELLAAFAWYFLTEDTAIYPGWSDILLFQAADMLDTHPRLVSNPSLRRPHLRSIGMPDEISWIANRLRRVTRKSWERTASDPDPIYSTAADIVLQQAAVRSSLMSSDIEESVHLPLATIFVASFDIELEMALWRRIAENSMAALGVAEDREVDSFAVIAPFFSTSTPTETPKSVLNTSFHWAYRIIRPEGNSVDAFLSTIEDKGDTKGRRWRLLSTEGRRELSRLPIIVHLAGAPLFSKAGGRALGLSETATVHHAILLDEYRALVEMATGFSGGQAEAWGDLVRSSNLLDRVGERFWLFIGAQLGDPAVRLRLLAQEMISMFGRGGSGGDDRTSQPAAQGMSFLRGLMVNEWSAASERAAFTWQAIDVVQAKASALVGDLDGIRQEVARMLEGGGMSR